jgi:excisionase family DNA binding protein
MQTPTIDAELLSVADLQRITSETESTWRKRLGRREIPFVRLGANVRIRREDFDEWLKERTVAVVTR